MQGECARVAGLKGEGSNSKNHPSYQEFLNCSGESHNWRLKSCKALREIKALRAYVFIPF